MGLFGKSAGDKLRDDLRIMGERSIGVQIGSIMHFGKVRPSGEEYAKVILSGQTFSVPYKLLARHLNTYGRYIA